MDCFHKRVQKRFHLAVANLLLLLNTYIIACFPSMDMVSLLSYHIRTYMHQFLVVRVLSWLWYQCRETANEVMMLVWPIMLFLIYLSAVTIKHSWDQASSEIRGFLYGLLYLDSYSARCFHVIHARRRTERDYWEKLDLAYCLSERDGVRAQPSLEKLKSDVSYYVSMACLFLLIAVLFYICGRLHAWYKHSLVPMTASNSATGMKSSRNATVFRPRAVIIRRVRNYLKPGRISRKRELGTVPTEPACRVENGHITAVAEATIKIEALIKAADDQKLPLGESLYLQWMTSNLQDVVMSQKAEIGQLKAANSLHHLIIPATPPQDARAEHEIAELKNELARSGEETRKAKIHRRELEDRLARMENERETNEVKAEKAETLEQMIINLKAELTHQRTTAKHDRKLLTEARNKIRSRDTELSEAAKAMTATQDQLKQVQDTCAEAMTAIQDQMSVLPGEPHVCDHGACQAIVQQELAALKEAKDVEIMELRIANDTETRALRRSLEASMTNFNTKSFKVSLLEGDLEGAKRGCESAVIENSTLRRAGQQIEVENAELKLKLSTMQREIASEKAKYKQLEGLQSLERTTLAPPVAHLGRSDDAAIPFENLPLSWPRPRVVEPEPTQTTRIAARVRAPMRSQTQAAGDDTSPLPTPSSSSAGLCQPARKQMDKLNEDDFAMRMKKYADQATNLHQKWNRANMTNAAGSGDVVKNFQEILRSWEYVKPEMLQESKLGQAVMRVLGTEGKWQGQPLAAISGVRRPPHVLMIKLGKEIQSKMAEMGQDQENKGGKRSRS